MTEPPDGVGATLHDPAAGAADGVATDDDEVEPVELLVGLAEEGEIEPWDIDIVAVTDAFLDRLDETDLRTSGRALFYASVLLRMKSDAMLESDEPDEPDEPEPWEVAMAGGDPDGGHPGGGGGGDPIAALDDELDRRLERKRARGSPETLDELVRELREAERDDWWKSSRTYDTSATTGRPGGARTVDYTAASAPRADDEPTAADVTGTTHTEEMDETVATVRAALAERFDAGRDETLFAEVRAAGGAPIHTYLALLFLAGRGVVALDQDRLFGDLWIRPAEDWAEEG